MYRRFFIAASFCFVLAALAAPAQAGYLGIMIAKHDTDEHIVIQAVIGDSPAEKAGLKIDDQILKRDGNDPGTLEQFVQAVRDAKAGDRMKFTIKRDGKEQDIEVTVGEAP